jgi:hypothetical protein
MQVEPTMQEKPGMLLPALYGGVVVGFLFGVPYLNYVNVCCCAGVLAGGALSVFFYKKDLMPGMPPLESSDSLKLGAMAGAIGGVVATILSQLINVITGTDPRLEIQASIDQMSGQQGTEGVIEVMEWILSVMDSPFFILGSLLFSVVICTIAGLLGGLIGYSMFKPKKPMMNMQPPTQ